MKRSMLLFLFPCLLLAGCKGKAMEFTDLLKSRLDSIPQEQLDSLSQRRIYFGHQSVGYNLMDGLRDLMRMRPSLRLNIRETLKPDDFAKPVFAHAPIGENRNPHLKIDQFREILGNRIGQVADIAFFKLCYLDIDHDTDIDDLFRYYNNTVEDLEKRFPNLNIITVTVPLRTKPSGLKSLLKTILGRFPQFEEKNIQRNLYNIKLEERYRGALFDLAESEATSPGGEQATFKKNDVAYLRLNPMYTKDGGHLNELGRKFVALELLQFLASFEGQSAPSSLPHAR